MIWSYFSTLPKIYKIPLLVVGIAAAGAVTLWVFGYVVMWLWNHSLTTVFAVPSITFWQALALFLLAKLFFGFGAGSSAPKQQRHELHRRKASVATAEEQMPDADELFKRYWREEGKQAYDAYLARKRSTGASDDAN